MNYVLAVLLGAVWGVLAGLFNGLITRRALRKQNDKALLEANLARSAVDIAALAAVFLLRERLPLPYTFVLVGTAAGLSITTIVISYRIAGGK